MAPDPVGSQVTEPVGGTAAAGTTAPNRLRAARRAPWKVWTQRYGALAALVALFVYNAIDTPFFLTRQSLLFILLRQAAPIAIVAVGMAIVIGTAGIDLSVGSVMAIAGQVGASLVLHGQPFLLAITAALLVSALCGVFNGTLVARYGVQPIIATLILFIAGRGIAQLITNGELQPLANPSFQWIGLARPFGVPAQVIIAFLVAVVASLVMRLTVYGRQVLAVGGNETASRLAGLAAGRVKMLAYVTSAVLAGLVGLITVSATFASDANNTGVGMELDAIAAVAVAGTPLTGGKVTIWGAVVGAVMLKLLQNTLITHGITKEVAQMIEGAVIVAALWLQRQEA
ncbi:MAG: galactofuranose transport system permease protein [Nocardioidaceae bacterium]|jgi:simple sugar transport system permease protein/ribose transport system permease protein|nr:galactofuranose transport system permease protein [Nocardioidaceae bacterium]